MTIWLCTHYLNYISLITFIDSSFYSFFRKLVDCLLDVQPCARPRDAEMHMTQFLPLKNALRISQCKGEGVKDKRLNRSINVAPLPPAYRSLDFEAGWQTADCCIHDPQSSLALHISVQFWGLRNPTKNLPKDTICIPHLTPTPYLLWGDPKFLSRNSITCLSILSMPSREIGTWKY